MRRLLTLTLLAFAVFCAGWTWNAHAVTTDPRIDAAASVVAHRAVTVGCYEAAETDSPDSVGAWGYVYLGEPYIYLDAGLCRGLLAINDPASTVATWQQGIGALALAHESYHLNLKYRDRGSEAKTECRATRAVVGMIGLMGGTAETVERLLPSALAEHYRIAAEYPAYNYRACRVPSLWH